MANKKDVEQTALVDQHHLAVEPVCGLHITTAVLTLLILLPADNFQAVAAVAHTRAAAAVYVPVAVVALAVL